MRLTPDQLVAYNLTGARQLRGLTQEQAAEQLAKHLGERWSKATWSAAERSIDSGRPRQFTATELVAFARTFELPVTYFFLPPGEELHDAEVLERTAPDTEVGWAQREMLGLVFGYGDGRDAFEDRLAAFIRWDRTQEGAGHSRTSVSQALRDLVATESRAAFKAELADLPRWRDDLRELANVLDRVERATVDALDEALEDGRD